MHVPTAVLAVYAVMPCTQVQCAIDDGMLEQGKWTGGPARDVL